MFKGIWNVAALVLLVGCFSCDDGVDDETDIIDDTAPPADFDGDGVPDLEDAFPNDPNESVDSDDDGVGDNADAFPNDASETVDTDGDGVGDNADAFPDDATQSADSDGDGLNDTIDPTPTGTTDNRLNGTFTGGLASIVEIDGITGGDPYDGDLTQDCSVGWGPQGTLCDESPYTHDPNRSAKTSDSSGSTWSNDTGAVGLLVVDAGQVVDFNEARIFQMFSDGKVTSIRLAIHPETGATPPLADDASWVTITGFESVSAGVDQDWQESIEAYVVIDPTVLDLDPQITRYVRIEVMNDNSLGDEQYIELRSIKLFDVDRRE